MILIIDNNTNNRGESIKRFFSGKSIPCTVKKYVTGDFHKSGDWSDSKTEFGKLIESNKILFIHSSNPHCKSAAEEFARTNIEKIVVIYSGQGAENSDNQYSNVYHFHGNVSNDAKAEWYLDKFVNSILTENKIDIDVLFWGHDPILESLLLPFKDLTPETIFNQELVNAKNALNDHVK